MSPEFDPWAPPAEDAPGPGTRTGGPGNTVFWSNSGTTQPPPSVHTDPTATSLPSAQPWANPFAPPGGSAPGTPQDNPFAPPASHASFAQPAAPGEPVPPPPIAPDGPGQSPYSYPGQSSGPAWGAPQQSGYAGPGPGYPAPPMYNGGPGYGWAPGAPLPSNGLGTASLVIGIIAPVLFCIWPLAIILGILAVVFGMIGRGKVRRGQATNAGQALAGIICGAVGIVLATVFGVLIILYP